MFVSLHSRRNFILMLIACALFGGVAQKTQAVLLYLDPAEEMLYRGDTVTLNLRIVTEPDECINTVDATIHYDAGIRAVDVGRGSSILNLWVENPTINEAERTITFAGGIPGGYCGRIPGDPSFTNVLAELVFRAPGLSVGGGSTEPAGRVWVDEELTQVLLHDGLGTRAPLRTEVARFIISEGAGSTIDDSWRARVAEDKIPPADFQIVLSRDEDGVYFNGEYFISFNTSDKQSGIDHYEVMEEPIDELYTFNWGRADAPWVREESPYKLKDQKLNSTIRVRAIDKAGNETIAVLIPPEAMRLLSTDRLITFTLLGFGALVTLLLLGYVFHRRQQRVITKRLEEEILENDEPHQ